MYYSEICWLCIPDTLGTDEQKLVSDKINLMLEKHDLYTFRKETVTTDCFFLVCTCYFFPFPYNDIYI
jgi:hypothetical protein